MSITERLRERINELVFGDALLPQEFTVGLCDPQTEIAVWLQGLGAPRDITSRYSTACSSPFVLAIAFEKGEEPDERDLKHLYVTFCERGGQKRVLGTIGLKFAGTISPVSFSESRLLFFEPRTSANYCLPALRLGAHYLRQQYRFWRSVNTSDISMSFLERRAAIVTFIRPHPISLVSVADALGGNIFTMNIMGELGHGFFGFALRESRTAAHIVQRAGRLALSTVPLPQSRFVFQLAANHLKHSIDWAALGFATKKSRTFHVPIPDFAARVREMDIKHIRRIGSHSFFVAQIVTDESYAETEIVCAVHGFYQAWRMKGRREELKASVIRHRLNKRGFSTP
jgi:flavin reductase (DIM6/NTAB) family NADH-FMN oxidoreductase RutF